MEKQTGLTQTVGFQFGLRKTFPIPAATLWDFLFSESGLALWLGELRGPFENGRSFQTKEGVEGLLRVLRPYSHIRLNWKKKTWNNMSTLQVRVIENGNKATLGFHQEKLLNSAQRDEMKEYWNAALRKITDKLSKTVEKRK